jgi:hypothetical protein
MGLITERLQMNSISYRKALNLFLLAGNVTLIILPDMVFGLFSGIVHLLLELAHMIFEFIEVNLDRLVEHIFETEVHQTQVIVFYLMLSIAFGGLYYLWSFLPRVYHQSKENLLTAWLEQKAFASLYWRDLSLINKIKWAAISTAGIYCIVFLNF